MAESSIPPTPYALTQIHEDIKYLYISNTNVSNFVSVKLSCEHNYPLWETQMLCLMETYNLHGIVDTTCIHPRALSPEIEKQYNCLVKGWIFGSISEELLGTVRDLGSAKEVWDKLKSFYDPAIISSQQVFKGIKTIAIHTTDDLGGTRLSDQGVGERGRDEIHPRIYKDRVQEGGPRFEFSRLDSLWKRV